MIWNASFFFRNFYSLPFVTILRASSLIHTALSVISSSQALRTLQGTTDAFPNISGNMWLSGLIFWMLWESIPWYADVMSKHIEVLGSSYQRFRSVGSFRLDQRVLCLKAKNPSPPFLCCSQHDIDAPRALTWCPLAVNDCGLHRFCAHDSLSCAASSTHKRHSNGASSTPFILTSACWAMPRNLRRKSPQTPSKWLPISRTWWPRGEFSECRPCFAVLCGSTVSINRLSHRIVRGYVISVAQRHDYARCDQQNDNIS